MKILIVDDSQHVHTQLKVFLNSAGYDDLVFAASGQEALNMLNIGISTDEEPDVDLILMDIEMSEMDGIEATKRIKKNDVFQDIPIIMVTADTSSKSLQSAFDAGAVDYITKPFRKIELLARIKSFLALKRETDTRKSREREKENLIKELQQALDQINTLRGIIPICASCKKVRDDEGYWQQVESYVQQHSAALFSHGICPDCAEKFYQDIEEYKKKL